MTSDFIKNMTHIATRIPIGKTKKLTDILMIKGTKIPIFPHSTFYSSFSASARNVEDPKEFNPTEISQRMPCRKIGILTASKSDCR